jgi:hypothetical protein
MGAIILMPEIDLFTILHSIPLFIKKQGKYGRARRGFERTWRWG